MGSVVKLLDEIIAELDKKDFFVPVLPTVTPDFTGRDNELKEISEHLKTNNVLFVNGVGGIGKSTLVRKFIREISEINKIENATIICGQTLTIPLP